MSNPQEKNRRTKEIAMIHIASKQLGMDEETYRAMLFTIARVRSSADLDHAGRQAVIAHLKSRGFVAPVLRAVGKDKQATFNKIQALLKAANLSPAYADGIAFKMFGLRKIQWCDADQMRKIIAALKYQQQRLQQQRLAPKKNG